MRTERPAPAPGARVITPVVGHPRRRGRAMLIASFILLTVLAAQVFRIQGIDAASVSRDALDSRLATQTVPAVRGTITDADGTVLASSVERRNVTIDATLIHLYKKDGRTAGIPGAARDIAAIVGGNPDDLQKIMQSGADRKSQFAFLVKDISPDQWRRVNELRIPGVFSQRVVKRIYPQGTAVAPVLGWLSANGEPGGGVELMQQNLLKGTPGVHTYEQALDGTIIATGDNKDIPAKPGGNVRLTIDNDIQWYTANAIANGVKQHKAKSGTAIVMDTSGNLVAVAQAPSYDNNSIATADPDSLQMFAFSQPYEPGSVSKAITIAAALDTHKIDTNSHVPIPASRTGPSSGLKRADIRIQDSEEHGPENLTTTGVVAESSNMGTSIVGEKLSPQTLYSYMCKFGFCSRSGIGFPSESGGLVPTPNKWTGSTRYTVLYGQGLSTTAIQQASVFQTIANGGVRMPPKLIRAVDTGNGWQAPADSRTPTRVVSTKVADELRTMLEGVVSKEGTAPKAQIPGYHVAGKTGTADRYDEKLGRYNGYTASFVGFAPATKPRYIVLVSIDDPKVGMFGGDVAAPIFADIMGKVLSLEKVPPDGDQPTSFPLTYSESTEGRRQ